MSAYDPFDSVLDNPYLKYLKNNKNSEEYYSQEYDRKKYDEHYTKIYETSQGNKYSYCRTALFSLSFPQAVKVPQARNIRTVSESIRCRSPS